MHFAGPTSEHLIGSTMLLGCRATLLCIVATKLIQAATDLPLQDTTPTQVRRKQAFKHPPTEGRLSLMNTRFAKRPRKRNMDDDHLADLLGHFFDPLWMSAEEPASLANRDPEADALYVVRQDTVHYSDMVKQLKVMNISRDLLEMGAQKLAESPHAMSVMESWLVQKASCPVRYAWEDIGSLFWPRYIKRGTCTSQPGTCSWPPGMHCVPSGVTRLHVLRWQCKVPRRARKDGAPPGHWAPKTRPGEPPLKCSWVRVPYPITSDCMCTC